MSDLIVHPNIDDPDDFYDELLRVHEGLDDAASQALNARLILVLCNHVGDRAVLAAALAVAARPAASMTRPADE